MLRNKAESKLIIFKRIWTCILIVALLFGVVPSGLSEVQAEGSTTLQRACKMENTLYEYTTIDGKTVTSEANGTAKILVFFNTSCWYSQQAIKAICQGSYDYSDVDIIAVDVMQKSAAEVRSFKETYGSDEITFAYDEQSNKANSTMWVYLQKVEPMLTSTVFPVIVMIDESNQVRGIDAGIYQEEDIVTDLADFCNLYFPEKQEKNPNLTKVSVDVEFKQADTRSIVGMVNELRLHDAWYWDSSDSYKVTASNLQPLTYDYTLEQIAMQRAAEMALFYGHERPNQENCFTAYDEYRYKGATGENIAAGYSSTKSVFVAWSEAKEKYAGQGHRRNMLAERATAIGVGHVVYNGVHYWAMELGNTVTGVSDHGIDGKQTVTLEVLKDYIKDIGLDNSYEVVLGQTEAMPTVEVKMYSPSMWPKDSSRRVVGSMEVSWTLEDDTIAQVTDGKLLGKALGSTKATAVTASGQTFSTTIKVVEAKSHTSNNKNEKPQEVYHGEIPEITATPTTFNTIMLNWPAVSGAKSYEIFYSTSPDSGFKKLTNAKKNFYKFSKAKCGVTYYFQLRVCTKGAKSAFGEAVNATTNLIGTPELQVKKTTYNSVALKWSKVPGAKKYEILYSNSLDGNWTSLGLKGGTSFTHKKLVTGATYYYQIRPVRDSFQGEMSNSVVTKTILSDVTRLKVKAQSADRMKLTWKKVPGATQYVILRSTEKDGTYEIVGNAPKPSYVDTALQAGTTYFYKVYAVSGAYKTKETEPVAQMTKPF